MSLLEELEAIAQDEGFPSAQAFVSDFILRGQTFRDLTEYLAEKYYIHYSVYWVYEVARPLCKFPIRRKYYNVLLYHSRKAGYKRIEDFVDSLQTRPLKQLTLSLGLKSPPRLRQTMERIRRGLIPVKRRRRKWKRCTINREGFRSLTAYRRWKRKAQELGYRTLWEAIYVLEHRKGLSSKEVARLFGVTQQAYLSRRKKLIESRRR